MLRSVFLIGIGMLFIFSGTAKLFSLSEFYNDILLYGILPERFVSSAMVLIILTECLCGLMFVFRRHLRSAGYALVSLLTFFTAAVLVVLYRGDTISCGCFGSLDQDPVSALSLVRNILLIAIVYPTAIRPLRSSNG